MPELPSKDIDIDRISGLIKFAIAVLIICLLIGLTALFNSLSPVFIASGVATLGAWVFIGNYALENYKLNRKGLYIIGSALASQFLLTILVAIIKDAYATGFTFVILCLSNAIFLSTHAFKKTTDPDQAALAKSLSKIGILLWISSLASIVSAILIYRFLA